MNPLYVSLTILVAALAMFLLTRKNPRAWWPLLSAIVIASAGIGVVWMVEKGPQSAFSHLPVSATRLAWIGAGLALAGLGAMLGVLVRGCLALAKKK